MVCEMPALESAPRQGGPADLSSRLAEAEAEIARLRSELLVGRAEARSLAEAIPHAISRRVVVRSIVADAVRPSAWFAGLRRRLVARRGR